MPNDKVGYYNGWMRIDIAVKHGDDDLVRSFLSHPNHEEVQGFSIFPLTDAIRLGKINVIKMLLADYRIDPAKNNNWALRGAEYCKTKDTLHSLLLVLRDKRVNAHMKSPSMSGPSYSAALITAMRFDMVSELQELVNIIPESGVRYFLMGMVYHKYDPNIDKYLHILCSRVPMGWFTDIVMTGMQKEEQNIAFIGVMLDRGYAFLEYITPLFRVNASLNQRISVLRTLLGITSRDIIAIRGNERVSLRRPIGRDDKCAVATRGGMVNYCNIDKQGPCEKEIRDDLASSIRDTLERIRTREILTMVVLTESKVINELVNLAHHSPALKGYPFFPNIII